MVDNNILNKEEKVIGFVKEVSNVDTIGELEGCAHLTKVTQIIPLNSVEMYVAVNEFVQTVIVNTKYKTVDWKVRPAAVLLPADSFEQIKTASSEVILRDPKRIGHTFTDSTRMRL
jgi:hypothetical protein